MFASRVEGLDVSGIRKLFEAAGEDAIHLGIGEPHLQPPDHVIEAYITAVREGRNRYSPTAGLPALRAALVERYQAQWPGLSPDNVGVTTGSTSALLATLLSIVEDGDEVLVPDPGFVLYAPHTRLCGGKAQRYPLHHDDAFQPDLDALAEAVTPETKAIIVNSPSNPTGVTLTEASIQGLQDIAEDNDAWLLSDEAYDAFTYSCDHVSLLDRGIEKLVYFNTFSKRYAMTGWRLGYAIAPPEMAAKIRVVGYHMYAAPPTPAQHAALAALQGPQDHTERLQRELTERRDAVVAGLEAIDGVDLVAPTGAIYAFPRIQAALDSMELAMRLLDAGVVTVPGSAFGDLGEGHIRLSFATSLEDIECGLQVLAKVLDGL